MIKNKKSQFYIFTAIILSTYLFALASAADQKIKESSKFEIIKDNFVQESSFAVNSAVYNQGDISQQLKQFTEDFIDYAKTKGNELEVLYLLVQEDIEISNYLNTEVKISNKSLNRGETKTFDKTNQITVEAYNNIYVFAISDEPLQLKAMLRAEENHNIQVYVLR